jgi:uncharacterized membrane protein YheB (UPF0754 family)
MTVTAIKEKLHSYIEHADDKKLKAIYTLLENEVNADIADEKLIEELDRRWDNYLSGASKTYTIDESIKEIKKHRNSKKSNAV